MASWTRTMRELHGPSWRNNHQHPAPEFYTGQVREPQPNGPRTSTSRIRHGKEIGSRTSRRYYDNPMNFATPDGSRHASRKRAKLILHRAAIAIGWA